MGTTSGRPTLEVWANIPVGNCGPADAFVEATDEDTGEKYVKAGRAAAASKYSAARAAGSYLTATPSTTRSRTKARESPSSRFAPAYNKLSTRVASKLKDLGFTAASDDGVDLPYFAKYD